MIRARALVERKGSESTGDDGEHDDSSEKLLEPPGAALIGESSSSGVGRARLDEIPLLLREFSPSVGVGSVFDGGVEPTATQQQTGVVAAVFPIPSRFDDAPPAAQLFAVFVDPFAQAGPRREQRFVADFHSVGLDGEQTSSDEPFEQIRKRRRRAVGFSEQCVDFRAAYSAPGN